MNVEQAAAVATFSGDGDEQTTVLGIDPGTASMGYGAVRGGVDYELLDFGCLTTSAGQPPERRLLTLYRGLLKLVEQHQPNVVAVERLFFSRNVKTALAVGQARGVVLLAAASREVPVAEYTPLEVKQAVTGFGRADKEQVQRMVQALFQLAAPPRPDDAADALAVAVCHLHAAPALRLGLR
ncbi:MAG: crossover junction endodeoxyribonuclease RuvC [Dehalococcoidia bacterium]|nr:crossover junction endodeoxyribonuclease RuvC [Dehalococcoidia bacterium]